MRFASLGSGSRGNALVVEHGRTIVLIDCGFSVQEVERRMARLGRSVDTLDAIVVTHEHGDHANGVARLARRYGLPVWMTSGTHHACGDRRFHRLELFCAERPFAIGDLELTPYTVPHDAREPCQFVVSDGAVRLGLLTDIGIPTTHVQEQLHGCDALLIECNHDPHLLATGPYPPSLKQRVSGPYGHLSNQEAAALLDALDRSRLRHVVAMHLSENNNRPELAKKALADVLGTSPSEVCCATQEGGFDWRSI